MCSGFLYPEMFSQIDEWCLLRQCKHFVTQWYSSALWFGLVQLKHNRFWISSFLRSETDVTLSQFVGEWFGWSQWTHGLLFTSRWFASKLLHWGGLVGGSYGSFVNGLNYILWSTLHRISAGFAPSTSVTLLQVGEISIAAISHRFAQNLLWSLPVYSDSSWHTHLLLISCP